MHSSITFPVELSFARSISPSFRVGRSARWWVVGSVVAAMFLAGNWNLQTAHAQDAKAKDAVDFSREILPILSDKCFVCHGPDTHDDSMLRLDSYENATLDRDGSVAINIKNLAKSLLIDRIHSADDPMPPEDAQRQLTDSEKELLSRWVKQGAKYTKHWAYKPPQKTAPQTAKKLNSVESIDWMISQKMNEKGIGFAPAAQREILARRVALILTGLPPEREQLEAYLNDDSEDSYSKLVESLLNSPRFGEHQARFWLDAVRYGDTHGLHLDNKRGIYPYRDWVVRAFNQNMPLDQFFTWQLAGDLLPNPNLEKLVATGFVRMNPSTAEGGAIPAEFQAKNTFDRTETFGTVFLGMSLTCARCHTHKYDPILQSEYYQLSAFFNSTAESSMDGNSYTYGPIAHAPTNSAGWDVWNQIEKEANALLEKANGLMVGENKLNKDEAKVWNSGNPAAKLQKLAEAKGTFEKVGLKEKAGPLFEKLKAAGASFTTTLVAKELPKPRVTKVLKRGEYNLPQGAALEPNTPSVLGKMSSKMPKNRLGLAQWLTDRQNPLVSRVLINRIWQRTFGEALVRSPEDFGLQGRQPTHPQLLDWLAVELQESGWDLKHMLRLMVHTKTFRQSSSWRAEIDDPENLLFARGPSHRLDAEVIRDIGLWASGLLDEQMGGEGIKPYQPPGMWLALAHPGSNTKKYVRDKGQKLFKRSLYVYWKRTSPHPMMTLFDAPSRESSCVRRSRTNTALQSLGLLNETQRIEIGRVLAERLLKESKSDDQRLIQLFEMLASRKPSGSEKSACDALLAKMKSRFGSAKEDAEKLLATGDAARDKALDPVQHAAWTQLVVTVLASDIAILLY